MNFYDPALNKKNAIRAVIKILFLCLLLIYFTSCSNIFSDFADTSSNEALIKDIEITMKTDLGSALTKFLALPAALQAERDQQFLLATIYGGLCGINFFDLTTDVGSNPALMKALIAAFPGATTAEADYCISGEAVLNTIAVAGSRTVDENLLMVYMSWGKIGTILEAHGDPDGDNVYTGFDPCNVGELPDNYAKHLLTSLTSMALSFTAIGTGSGAGADQGGAVTALCTAVPAACTDTDIVNVDAAETLLIRGLAKDDSQGFGLGIVPVCAGCPC